MIHFLPNLLTKEECNFLSNKFDMERVYTLSTDDSEYSKTNNSYGFEPSNYFNVYLEKLKPKILEFSENIKELYNVNTYIREYKNGEYLKKHIDRKDISITMSICLESTINKEWPLFAEIDEIEHSFNTNIGDGILIFDADKHIHWRETLDCEETSRVVQFFLHWSTKNDFIKTKKTLI